MTTNDLPPAEFAGVLSEVETLRLPGKREAKVYIMVGQDGCCHANAPRRIKLDVFCEDTGSLFKNA